MNEKFKSLLGMATISIILGYIIHQINGTLPSHPITALASILGVAVVMFLVPAFALFFNVTIAWVLYAIFAGLLVFSSFSNKSNNNSQALRDINEESYVHKSMNCSFSVAFPKQPKINKYTMPGFGDYEEAVWARDDGFNSVVLKSECFPTAFLGNNASYIKSKEFMIDTLQRYSVQNGLENVSYQFIAENNMSIGAARGYKTINNAPATYQIKVVIGNDSVITQIAGGLSSAYPQPEVSPFFDSVKEY